MLCKKCGGNLLFVEDTIVECENCHTKYRVKPKQPQSQPQSTPLSSMMTSGLTNSKPTVQPQVQTPERKIEIDYSKPFSSREEQSLIEQSLMDLLNDDLNRTKTDDIKSKLIANTTEPELVDFQSAQDINDVIKDYEQDNYPETRPLQENIYCSKCNNLVDLKTGICPQCQNVMPLPERRVITCPFCHYEQNNIRSEFCIKCGKDLDIERERLGIVLKEIEHKKPQKQSSGGSKEQEKGGKKASGGKIFFNLIACILLGLQAFALIKFDFISTEGIKVGFDGLLKLIQNFNNTTELGNILTEMNLSETAITFFTNYSIIFQVLSIAFLVMIATAGAYVLGSLFKMITSKTIMKGVMVLSVVNFMSSILFVGIMELIIYKATAELVLSVCSPLVSLIVSIVVMFISFMII